MKLSDNNACFGIGGIPYITGLCGSAYQTPPLRPPRFTKVQSMEKSTIPDGIDAKSGQTTLEERTQ